MTVDRLDGGSFTQAGRGSRCPSLPGSAHSTTYPPSDADAGPAGGFQLTRMLLFPMATAETS